MDLYTLNNLVAERQWTELLRALPEGETKLGFPDLSALNSCKAVAYSINSDKTGRSYYFKVNKDERSAIITVKEK